MAGKYRTQDLRSELGMQTTDTFLVYVVAKLKWSRGDIETDLLNRIRARFDSAQGASSLQSMLIARLDQRYNLYTFVKDTKDAYSSVKSFAMTPTAIAKMAYGSMSKLAKMAFDAADAGMDRNRYYFPTDEYMDYLLYTYVTAGQVQPRHTGLI